MANTSTIAWGNPGGTYDYSSGTNWEAGVQGVLATIEYGDCYKAGGDFAERCIMSGSTTDATKYLHLRAASGEQFTNGTKGTGVVFDDASASPVIACDDDYVKVNGLEITGGSSRAGIGNSAGAQTGGRIDIWDLLIYDVNGVIKLNVANLFYAKNIFTYGTGTSSAAIDGLAAPNDVKLNVYNITAVRQENDVNINASGFRRCIARNCMAFHYGGASSHLDYLSCHANSNRNLSHDASAPGANVLINKTAANNLVNVTAAAWDLHLKASADARDAGKGSATYAEVLNTDIDGETRPTGDCDMGADERTVTDGSSGRWIPSVYYNDND